ncbi:MAG: ribonuclease III [Ruminococcaceae bacterium]|nr:ribonuclease III [Oscillospiraceae bacterium]MBD5117230.1 ribonuclease III [Oscillospiraceae bacterium]
MTALEERIGYEFKNPSLLKEALTHSSYVNGKNHHSNERLEFLGDSVLSVVVSKYLFENLTDKPEGQLTKLRASIVCEHALFPFAEKIKLGEEIYLGKGEENTGGRHRRSILADAFEALIAAIYLDGGLEAARRFILPFIPPIESLRSGRLLIGDYKTILQEIIQQNPEEKVVYELADESGAAHNRIFTSNVLLNGQIIGTGVGASKKEAEQNAAKEAVRLMGYETN